MSAIVVDSIKLAANQSNIYGGFFVFVIGMIGNILNFIVFTSLKTFRETSAAFYMTMASVVNIFQLTVGLLSRILITGYNIDPTKTSSVICKIRQFILITTMRITFSCMCFAAIDQYLSLINRWRHLCNVKIVSRLVIVAFVALVKSVVHLSISVIRFLFPVLLRFLPLIIRIIFGYLAFITVRCLNNRQVPFVRLERDKQLTIMVLVEVVVDVILTLPYSIYNHLYSSSVKFSDPVSSAQNQLIIAVTHIAFYGNFAVAFYIYLCVSSRFRKQLVYVLVDIHLKRWRERVNRNLISSITPQSLVI